MVLALVLLFSMSIAFTIIAFNYQGTHPAKNDRVVARPIEDPAKEDAGNDTANTDKNKDKSDGKDKADDKDKDEDKQTDKDKDKKDDNTADKDKDTADKKQDGDTATVGAKEPLAVKSFAAINGMLMARQNIWSLELVNQWNAANENPTFEPVYLGSNITIDRRCYQDLQNMIDDCSKQAGWPIVYGAYRSHDGQAAYYNEAKYKYTAQGLSEEEASKKANLECQPPGYSDHQTALSVDLVDAASPQRNVEQQNTETNKWLQAHCYEYGFILRFPEGKEAVTGITYQPWHFRYVGKDHAKIIHDKGITLEEYLGKTKDKH